MFRTASKEELCQISLTGIRSITLLGLLIEAPRSLEEIREAFIGYNIMEDSNSDDILRIDINTLRSLGCEISRSSKKTDYKYVLTKHPFAINITLQEVSVIRRAYNSIKDTLGLDTLIKYDILFDKIAKYITDEDVKQEMLGISSLKGENIDKINELRKEAKEKNTVCITYKSPVAKKNYEKEIVATDVICRNDKAYLLGIDKKTGEPVMLNLRRILSFFSKGKESNNISAEPVSVKFMLREFGPAGLTDEEIILEQNDDSFIISGKYHNKFIATQRILSFGASCTVLEPEEFKTHIIETLKNMKEIY